jgi:hypothetical protein
LVAENCFSATKISPMLRKYFLISLLISISILSYAQFTKIFDGTDGAQKILLSDNGVIIIPISPSLGGGATRVDTSGNLIWSKNILKPVSSEKITTRTSLMKNDGAGDFWIGMEISVGLNIFN